MPETGRGYGKVLGAEIVNDKRDGPTRKRRDGESTDES